MISPVLSRRRSIPVIVRREDAEQAARGRCQTRRRARARRRGLPWLSIVPARKLAGGTTRTSLIAVAVLVAASVAWILTIAYLSSLG